MDSTCKPPETLTSPCHTRVVDELATSLQQLEDSTLRYKDMQASLREFLADYYVKVGPLLYTLDSLRAQQQRTRRPDSTHEANLLSDECRLNKGGSALSSEMKRLYRELAKTYHPDGHIGPSEEMMRVINHAYAQKNLASLWKLSLGLREQTTEDLQRRLENIRQSLQSIQESVHALEQSAEYQLMQRVFYARLSGRDLIRRIVEDLAQDIAREEQRLQLVHQRAQYSAQCLAS
ncbi:MAG: J domain-containing protein [Rickettsiales bacterium]|nr:J domain-containing protein [Rickettsiales bacterium]